MGVYAGVYKCAVSAVEGGQTLSMLSTDIRLQAVVEERDGQPRIVSNVLTIPFLPAFYLHTSDVQLSNTLTQAAIRLSASALTIKDLKVSVL